MGSRLLPDPLWFPDLSGDIFIPGLLGNQNTGRDTLAKEFVRPSNKKWQQARMFLVSQVAPPAKRLIDRDTIHGDAMDALTAIAQMFNERFGEPEKVRRPECDPPDATPDPDPDPGSDGAPKVRKTNGGGERQRYLYVNVRGIAYRLYYGQPLYEYIFAQVSFRDPHVILTNVRGGYKSFPPTKAAKEEHCLMQVLMAICRSQKPQGTPEQIIQLANEIRADLFKRKQ
jgi:hypothetical protein